MAMHESDELVEVVSLMLGQMLELNVNINSMNIHEIGRSGEDDYLWVAAEGQSYEKRFKVPRIDHPYNSRMDKAIAGSKEFFSDTFTKAEKDRYFKNVFKNSDFKPVTSERQNFILSLPGFHRTCAISKHAAICAFTYNETPLTSEEVDILIRFTKVFNQAYTRFVDLQRAEAQAREAQIETALERVRAASMAMHQTSDFHQVSKALEIQLQELSLLRDFEGVIIAIFDEGDRKFTMYRSYSDLQTPLLKFTLEAKDHRLWEENMDNWSGIPKLERKNETHVLSYKGKDINRLMASLEKIVPSHMGPEEKEKVLSLPDYKGAWYDNCAYFSEGSLILSSFSKIDDSQLALLSRFAKVFEQAYTRFLDLQKAENQAREAQIEAALERVRAASMAMHRSEDLHQVSLALQNQLREIGILQDFDVASVNLIDEKNYLARAFQAQPGVENELRELTLHINEHRIWQEVTAYWKSIPVNQRKTKTREVVFEGADWDQLLKWIRKNNVHSEDELNFIMSHPNFNDKLHDSFAFFSHGALNISTWHQKDQVDIETLSRFSRVFEQAYTRYLDLQRAEKQAREALIEAALERVRAASMAMHDTTELASVIQVVFDQLVDLNIDASVSNLAIPLNEMREFKVWIGNEEGGYAQNVIMPVDDNPIFQSIISAYNSGETFLVDSFSKETKDQIFHLFFTHSSLEVSDERKEMIFQAPGFARSTSISSSFVLSIANYQGLSFSEEANAILIRFSSVFEQAYTRFLDLQKAEAQAREAQIEASLERVRAASMAMHDTSELAGVIQVVFDQIADLNFDVAASNLLIPINDMTEYEVWIGNETGGYVQHVVIPVDDNSIAHGLRSAIDSGKTSLLIDSLSKEEKDEMFHSIFTQLEVSDERKEIIFQAPSLEMSTAISPSFVLTITNYQGFKFSEEANAILMRFSSVFEQAYTRFLDLQKSRSPGPRSPNRSIPRTSPCRIHGHASER